MSGIITEYTRRFERPRCIYTQVLVNDYQRPKSINLVRFFVKNRSQILVRGEVVCTLETLYAD